MGLNNVSYLAEAEMLCKGAKKQKGGKKSFVVNVHNLFDLRERLHLSLFYLLNILYNIVNIYKWKCDFGMKI